MEKTIFDYVELLVQMVIAIAAIVALRQITTARSLAKISAKREALRLTAEQCRGYGERIIPILNSLDEMFKKHNFRMVKESTITVDDKTITVKPFVEYPEHRAAFAEINPTFTTAYNALNAFALYFVSGVAHEKSAYATLGTTYCHSVRLLLPLIIGWSEENREDNVLRLFMLWNSRKEREAQQRQIQELQEKLNSTQSVEIRPIGT